MTRASLVLFLRNLFLFIFSTGTVPVRTLYRTDNPIYFYRILKKIINTDSVKKNAKKQIFKNQATHLALQLIC